MDAPDEDPTAADECRGEGRAEPVSATRRSASNAGEVVFPFPTEQCRDAWSDGHGTTDSTVSDEVTP